MRRDVLEGRRGRGSGRLAAAFVAVLLLAATGCSSATSGGAAAGRLAAPDDSGLGHAAAFGRGALIGADSLSNTTIGGPKGTVLAFRFRSGWTGRVTAVRFSVVVNSDVRTGYSGGTFGRLRVTLADSRGGHPGRMLASSVIHPSRQDAFPLVRFPVSPRVAAGRHYQVVFTNVDRAPRRNYASVNALVQHGHGESLPRVPDGLAALLGTTSDGGTTPVSWGRRAILRGDRYVPILDVSGAAPGQHVGVGYMEAWVSRPKSIGGADGVRQVFVTNAARGIDVSGAWLRVARLGAASAPLELRLETPGGHVMAAASVPADRISTRSPEWVHVRFGNPVHLGAGEAAALRAAAASPSYATFPVRKGTDFGFDSGTVFTAGYAQFTTGGDWTGWDQWGVSDRRDGDLQFALDLR